MQLFPDELALANLKGEVSADERGHMSREDAYAMLKELSGKDFDGDIAAWEDWVERRKKERPSKYEIA